MTDLRLVPDTSVWATVEAEPSILAELADHFSYYVQGYQYHPLYKKGYWDGRKSLFNKITQHIYRGLTPRIATWARSVGYDVEDLTGIDKSWTPQQSAALSTSLQIPEALRPRDYQARAIHHGLHHRNGIIISPTGSGKSLILYHWVRAIEEPVLVIVPLVQLRDQLVKDFRDYGWTDVDNHVHRVVGTKNVNSNKRVVISTWHSLKDQNALFFNRFKMVICDEVHHAHAPSLIGIMEKCRHTAYRLGCTGTLRDAKAHQWVIEGLFGPVYRDKTGGRTKQLQDKGYLSKIQIHRITLQWQFPPEFRYQYLVPEKRRTPEEAERLELPEYEPARTVVKGVPSKWSTRNSMGWSYQEEVRFLSMHDRRNRFLGRLTMSLPSEENVLLLFTLVENHGKLLHQWFQDTIERTGSSRHEYFIAGETPTEDRELFRRLTEEQQGVILTASNGAFSTGINVKNLHHLILGCSSKSEYRVMQGIGRGLRTHPTKQILHVYDIVDDWRTCGYDNYTYIHSLVRMDYYKREQFPIVHSTVTFTA